MERLPAADAWFLYLEGPTVPLHVTGVLMVEPSTAPGGFSFAKLRRYIQGRLDLMPMLRRRLVEVPLSIDHPYWIEDPDFDLDQHLFHHVLPGPGSDRALADYLGELAAEPLDRSRPLWTLTLIEGMDDGTAAIVMKLHHCMIDGGAGMEVMADLLDLTPKPKRRTKPDTWEPEAQPPDAKMAATAAWNRIKDPLRPVRAASGVSSSLFRMATTAVGRRLGGADEAAHPVNAPRTRFSGSLTANRSVAIGMKSLADFKTIGRAFDVTVNDVFLAACTHGLRAHLDTYDKVPDCPLVCSIPVSTHGQSHREESTNQVSSMFVHLPVNVEDPMERLRLIHAGSLAAKEIQSTVGADMIADIVEAIPIGMFRLGTRLYSEASLADRLAPVHNLIVSNVVGSPIPLYMAGARVDAMYPFGPLMEGTGLNITVISHDGNMNIGVIACPDLVPNVAGLLDAMLEGVDVLLETARSSA